jgi:hypothetical protein
MQRKAKISTCFSLLTHAEIRADGNEVISKILDTKGVFLPNILKDFSH